MKVWIVLGAVFFVAQAYYFYSLGWYRGETNGIRWARQSLYGSTQ